MKLLDRVVESTTEYINAKDTAQEIRAVFHK